VIWDLPTEARLVLWRNFRKTLEWKDLENAAKASAEWWAEIPVEEASPNVSAPWATDTWPDPWNLMADGPLDHTHISVAIAYTLWMTASPEDKERIELGVLNSHERRQILLVVLIDNKWLINYNSGKLVDMSQLGGDTEMLSTHTYSTFKSRIKA
jgi:hypothetical protein